MKKRALISCYDKSGVLELSKKLIELGYEILSTGGTFKALSDAGINVTSVSDVTGFPECLDGRVKTLHPKIHGGILAMRGNEEHMSQLKDLGVDTIDLVAINLYPFKETMEKPGASLSECIEQIDIGGPTMLRSAAKNYQDVVVLVDPKDYDETLRRLENESLSKDDRLRLSYKVFAHTAAYDSLIAGYLNAQIDGGSFPEKFTVTFDKAEDLRYGENPHQQAAFYHDASGDKAGTIAYAIQLHGKELSFNNIADASAALDLLKEFESPCAVAVKHANPCGVGEADDLFAAFTKAYDSDPVSIYGGIVALNREVDEKLAKRLSEIFLEIILAPSFTDAALKVLKEKKNLRLLALPDISKKANDGSLRFKKVAGGLLVQSQDISLFDQTKLTVVTKKAPTKDQMEELLFAMKVVKHTKSNAIVLSKDFGTIGVGPGQTNRIESLKIAGGYAGDKAKDSVMASDAFFPFPDCVEEAARLGVSAIIQPGGSVRDELSIEAADKLGIAMVFTHERHFMH